MEGRPLTHQLGSEAPWYDNPPSVQGDAPLLWAALEAVGEAVLITTPDLEQPGPIIVYANPGFTRMTGYTREEAVGRSPRFLQGPETDRAVLDRMQAELGRGESFRGEAVNYRKDGSTYRIEWLITPMRDEAGRLTHWIAVQRDITDLRRNEERLRQAAEHQSYLLAELQHRVRNTLAVVRTIARRTGETSGSVEDYVSHLDGRLNAFSRVESSIARNPADGISLESLLADELLANIAREGEQAHISGPMVLLQPRAAETFGLALHELATNAVKYGALSGPEGQVRVTWRIEEAVGGGPSRLLFEWVEAGAQRPVLAPRPYGFGMNMLERTLPYDLGAETTIAFTPRGLTCRIVLPLTERVLQAA